MTAIRYTHILRALAVLGFAVAALPAVAAGPTAEQALQLVPVQDGVDYAKPTTAEASKCTISVRKFDGKVGWVVEDPQGLTLRKFVDTNGDNIVDQWSYYKDGIEVYRDIDSDFNGKADQYRWFQTAGTRWGIDKNEDGKIESWKVISPEEASAEVVAALATRNSDRFAALLLTPEELKSLGLGKERAQRLEEKLANLAKEFRALLSQQKTITKDTQWAQFSASRPGIVPIGTDGATRELKVYENVVAIVDAGGKSGQVGIGTLIQVGDAWRLIDLPQLTEETADNARSGFFFATLHVNRSEAGTADASSEDMQKTLGDLETLDKSAAANMTPAEHAKYTAKRAAILEKIAQQCRTPQDRGAWRRQLADMLSAAVQQGTYPDGAKELASLFEKVSKDEKDNDVAAYVRFRQLTAEYGLALQAPKVDFAKVQTEWLKTLETYVGAYPKSPDAAEAMLQLAIAQEFAGQEEDAMKWYGRITADFPDAPAAQKASGAKTRIGSVGKPLAITGKGANGSPVDTTRLRGKAVLIQYWATWSDASKADIPAIKDLLKKYPGALTVVGVNLDNDPKAVGAFLAEAKLPWPQIWEEGGLDSRPANQLGIVSVPTMILLDPQGKVIDRNIQTADIEPELKKLVK